MPIMKNITPKKPLLPEPEPLSLEEVDAEDIDIFTPIGTFQFTLFAGEKFEEHKDRVVVEKPNPTTKLLEINTFYKTNIVGISRRPRKLMKPAEVFKPLTH